MNLDQLIREISRLEHDIAGLDKQISDQTRKEAGSQDKINRTERSITTSTSPSTARSKLNEISRLRNDLARAVQVRSQLQKTRSDKSRHLAEKRTKLLAEESKERRKAQSELTEVGSGYWQLLDELRNREQYQHEQLAGPTKGARAVMEQKEYDVFISHASEDKDEVARPLYECLASKGLDIFFDEASIQWGDSLRGKIDHGLANCRFGIVILSPAFFAKPWPQAELDGLFAREMNGEK